MILLVGIPTDRVITYFANYLIKNRQEFRFLDINKLGTFVHLHHDSFELDNEEIIYFKDISGVYSRIVGTDSRQNIPCKFYTYLESLIYVLEYKCDNVVNRPSTTGSNNSKPYQLNYYKREHIKIPNSTILANSVCPKFQESTIYKSLSSDRSIVMEVQDKDIDREVSCPVLFQNNLKGNNIRVHVVSDKVFSLEITTETIDYRYTETPSKYKEVDLPKKIKAECISIARQNNFIFTGIDLILFRSNYYLLEANPCPGYTHFEEYMAEKAISKALLSVLRQ